MSSVGEWVRKNLGCWWLACFLKQVTRLFRLLLRHDQQRIGDTDSWLIPERTSLVLLHLIPYRPSYLGISSTNSPNVSQSIGMRNRICLPSLRGFFAQHQRLQTASHGKIWPLDGWLHCRVLHYPGCLSGCLCCPVMQDRQNVGGSIGWITRHLAKESRTTKFFIIYNNACDLEQEMKRAVTEQRHWITWTSNWLCIVTWLR